MKRYITATTQYTDNDIREWFFEYVVPSASECSWAQRTLLRFVLFNESTRIDWQRVYEEAIILMPDLPRL